MTSFTRRQLFRTATGALGYASATDLLRSAGLAATPPVKLGNILDKTGGLNIYCLGQIDATALAIDELNAAGGLIGRPVQLLFYDSQSNNQLNAEYTTKALLQDKVDILMGGVTSSSREVMRPIVHRYKGLYFYNSLYEGGVCDRLFYNTGLTPGQQLQVLVPAAVKRFGKKGYILAADYNYGTITAKWVQKFLREQGGQDVAVEFFPLDVNNFSPVIARIQEKKPNFVFSALVGAAHMSFYRQYAASGAKKDMPIASSTYGLGLEHTQLSPEENDGILICASYLPTIASPENKAFLDAMNKKFPGKYQVRAGICRIWLCRREALGRRREEGGVGGAREGDPRTRYGHLRQRAKRSRQDRSADPPRQPRPAPRGRQPRAQLHRAAVVLAIAAHRHPERLQPDQVSQHQQAVRDQALTLAVA